MYVDYYESFLGIIKIETNDDGILSTSFVDEIHDSNPNHWTNMTKIQLDEYFKGNRKEFDLPLIMKGTSFQKEVWNALMSIPYGKTKTYKEIATMINHPKAIRAVGNANHKNKFIILIPCHRVIGSNHKLIGYAYGIDCKQKLLDFELNY